MKVLSFLSVVTCLVFASNFVSAGPKDKQMSYQVDGQNLISKVGEVRTENFLNRPVSSKGEGFSQTSYRYSEGWRFVDICYVGGTLGYKSELINPEWHQTVTFKDGSTITELLLVHTICDVPATDDRLAYGTWELEWTVLGGTKSFEGASGSKYSSGTYQVRWDTSRSVSASYEGVANYDLD
mgnify:FL=1